MMRYISLSVLAIGCGIAETAVSQVYEFPLLGDCGPENSEKECVAPKPRPTCPPGFRVCSSTGSTIAQQFQLSFAQSTNYAGIPDSAPDPCSFNIDADPFDSCRAPVAGLVDNDLNFANGTAILVHEQFALTARHVTDALPQSDGNCIDVLAPWAHTFYVAAEDDLLYGSSIEQMRFPVLCVIEYPDPDVDLSLIKFLAEPPLEPELIYKLLDTADTFPAALRTPHHRTGFGLFESLEPGTCSQRPRAGQLKFGAAQETQCNPEQGCEPNVNIQLGNPSIDELDSGTCNADSGGAVTIEMQDLVEADGAVALRGIIIRKPTTERSCSSGSIAVDVSNADVQEWIISEIARQTGQDMAEVRDTVVHDGDPIPNLKLSDFITRANQLDDITNTCD